MILANEISISVRELIEFVLRAGDIKSVFLSTSRAVDGIKAHQKVQKRYEKEYNNYSSEVTVKDTINIEDITMRINGRIDGIIIDEITIIDEIKSVGSIDVVEENYNHLHWAQGKIYAYMYSKQHNLQEAVVQLTYVELGNYQIKTFTKVFTYEQLEKFYYDIINSYIVWAKKIVSYKSKRDISIHNIEFPFNNFRDGQRKFMTSVYKVILDNEKLFARAPTGIGKTMGTLFPAIKSLSKKQSKIFYLTAKTIGRDVAEKAINILESNQLIFKRVIITAKDKLCLNEVKKCDGEHCIYAKGHYDRINDALNELIDITDNYNRDIILEYANKYQVCPYELTLDLTLFCDCIICDYNYAFDPSAVLKRFFVEGNGDYIFLVDEAHNLIDRAREMYSSSMYKKNILQLKRKVKNIDIKLHKYLNQLNRFMIDIRHQCESQGDFITTVYYPEDFVDVLRSVIYRTEKIFAKNIEWEHMDELLEFYFDSYDFIRKTELYDDKYITYYEKIDDDIKMKIFCLDPSTNLRDYMANSKSSILFSATLTPMNYFVKVIGGTESSYGLILTSPFLQDNLCLLARNSIPTKYRLREKTYSEVVNTIYYTAKKKKGNYIAFFPSYKYMNDVYNLFNEKIDHNDIKAIVQERGLSEIDKEDFLQQFEKDRQNSFVAFAVLGGMFSEGIDLTGERLSGAIIVGVGLPSICYERDLIKKHFDKNYNKGYEYAYMFPGFNKVMQAAGRVIRTNEDVGVVVIIDERFGSYSYKSIFPSEWSHIKYINNNEQFQHAISKFWDEH
jgi:DNA excision repair protein ERCC-2